MHGQYDDVDLQLDRVQDHFDKNIFSMFTATQMSADKAESWLVDLHTDLDKKLCKKKSKCHKSKETTARGEQK